MLLIKIVKGSSLMNFEITIPVLNEEETLQENIEIILNFFEEHKLNNFSLCVADNGSSDSTVEIAKKIEKEHSSRLRLITLPRKGVGLALKDAWPSSDADIVGYMDLDLATNLVHILEIKKIFEDNQNVDIIYGSRLHKESKVIGRKLKRTLTSRVLNLIIQKTFDVSISDAMCGFKFYRKQIILPLIDSGAKSDGWFFCAETLIIGHKKGYYIHELPVTWKDDPNSKVKIIKLSLEYLRRIKELKKIGM